MPQMYFIKSKTYRKYTMHYITNIYSFGMRSDNKSRSQQSITDLNSSVTNLELLSNACKDDMSVVTLKLDLYDKNNLQIYSR